MRSQLLFVSALLSTGILAAPVNNDRRDIDWDAILPESIATFLSPTPTAVLVSDWLPTPLVLDLGKRDTSVTTPTATGSADDSDDNSVIDGNLASSLPAPTGATTTDSSGALIIPAAATSAAAAAQSTVDATDPSLQQDILDAHNIHRANHSAPALTWSDDLAASAQIFASSCVWAHNNNVNGGGYGQNIYAGLPTITQAVHGWYNGEVGEYAGCYGLDDPEAECVDAGHFTQLVWEDTTQVGCALVGCFGPGGLQGGLPADSPNPWFTVCNYGGPGNVGGEYADNVGEPLGQPVVDPIYVR